jgi:hypothetical protein
MTIQIAEAAGQVGQQSAGTEAGQVTVSPGVQGNASSAQSKNAGSESSSINPQGTTEQGTTQPQGTNQAGSEPAQGPAVSSLSNQANGSAAPAQNSAAQGQNGSPSAVGTAAAPAPEVTGIAGSSLTGAVIAPAKQRRVRTFLIRVGVVVGACVAIGTVVALSRSSPSQPRGATAAAK